MKWVWVLCLVFLVPWAVNAETRSTKQPIEIFDVSTMRLYTFILDGKVQAQSEGEWVRMAKFPTMALRDFPNVQIGIRLFFSKDLLPSEQPKGRCYLNIKGEGVFPLRDYFIYTSHGDAVWVPHLMDRQTADIFILWEPDAPVLQYARSRVGNEAYRRDYSWKTQALWDARVNVRAENLSVLFRELTLGEVCLPPSPEEDFPFSDEELKTFQY